MSKESRPAGMERVFESFRYPSIQTQTGGMLASLPGEGERSHALALQQEVSSAIEAARKQGLQDGLAQGNAAAAQAMAQERAAVATAVEDFARHRAEYFRRVEQEVVRLALSIARKVLHREAQLDPLLLAGVVRVALDQIEAGTRLTLRTSPASARSWAEFCSQRLEKEHAIEVVPDSSLGSHRCVLEADIGSTEISLDAQLDEIESGFFDRLRAPGENTP